MLQLHLSDQQFYCLLRCIFIRGLKVTSIISRSQGISSNEIDLVHLEYSSLSTRRVDPEEQTGLDISHCTAIWAKKNPTRWAHGFFNVILCKQIEKMHHLGSQASKKVMVYVGPWQRNWGQIVIMTYVSLYILRFIFLISRPLRSGSKSSMNLPGFRNCRFRKCLLAWNKRKCTN